MRYCSKPREEFDADGDFDSMRDDPAFRFLLEHDPAGWIENGHLREIADRAVADALDLHSPRADRRRPVEDFIRRDLPHGRGQSPSLRTRTGEACALCLLNQHEPPPGTGHLSRL